MLSLQDFASTNLAAQICVLPDLRKELMFQPGSNTHAFMKDASTIYWVDKRHWDCFVKKKAEHIVKKLVLPVMLQEKILSFILPVGIRIMDWVKYNEKFFTLSQNYLTNYLNICNFNSRGFIEEKKISQEIINDENLDIKQRFLIACHYCHKEEIASLYREISQQDWKRFHDVENPDKAYQSKIVQLWCNYQNGEINKSKREQLMDGIGLKIAVENGNKTAVEYFWKNMTTLRKEEVVIDILQHTFDQQDEISLSSLWISDQYFTDIFFYLFSEMGQDQQMEFFRKNTLNSGCFRTLRYFLDWPYQHHFMKTVKLIWNILPEDDYAYLLVKIAKKIQIKNYSLSFKNGDEDTYNYRILLKEYWSESPDRFKRYVFNEKKLYSPHNFIGNNGIGEVLLNLFSMANFTYEDIDVIRLIFSSANVEEKRNLILSCSGKSICSLLAQRQKWKTLDNFLIECLSRDEEIARLKREFCYSSDEIFAYFVKHDKYGAAEDFVKWTDFSEEEAIEFKEKICFTCRVKDSFADLVLLQGKIESADKFLDWCLSSAQKISAFKGELIYSSGVRCKCYNLLKNDRWECIERFVDWVCNNCEEEARILKRTLATRMGMRNCEILLLGCKSETYAKYLEWVFANRTD